MFIDNRDAIFVSVNDCLSLTPRYLMCLTALAENNVPKIALALQIAIPIE